MLPGSFTCAWYSEKGEPLLTRAPDNERDSDDTRAFYIKLIQSEGILEGARSDMIGIPKQQAVVMLSKVEGQTLSIEVEFCAGATLIEAFYEADTMTPNNSQVSFTRKVGLRSVRFLDPRTPTDIRAFFMDLGNKFNGIGAKTSFMELYNLVGKIEQGRKDWNFVNSSSKPFLSHTMCDRPGHDTRPPHHDGLRQLHIDAMCNRMPQSVITLSSCVVAVLIARRVR
jgi:hypothetical protein